MAPGMASRMALSTISMTVIDTVSAAKATGMAADSARRERSTGPMVKE